MGKLVKVLLGNGDGLLNNLITTLVQEVSGYGAQIETVATARINEYLRLARQGDFDLLTLVPTNLISDTNGRATPIPLQDGMRVVRSVRANGTAPLLAIALSHQREQEAELLRNAGADYVFSVPFDCGELKTAIAHILDTPAAVPLCV
jgi:DNA-binding response OmpR family regulator